MSRLGLAALAVASLTACPPDVAQPRAYACTHGSPSTEQCTGGWYCARDGYCHARDGGDTVPCTEETTSEDCPAEWFCGVDALCHDRAAPATLTCEDDRHCGGGWHCGVRGRCYDPSDAGAIACRRVDGGAPLFSGYDCASDWRCGVDEVCHPSTNAGSVPCAYPADTDCTDGWRCGANGKCTNPAGEQLAMPAGVTAGTPLRLTSNVPDGKLVAIGAAVNEGSQPMLLLLDSGVLLQVDHVKGTDESVVNGDTFRLRRSSIPAAGFDTDNAAVALEGSEQANGFGFGFRNGMPVRWAVPPDGGTVVVQPITPVGGFDANRVRIAPTEASAPWGLYFRENGNAYTVDQNGTMAQAMLPPGGLLKDVVPAPCRLGLMSAQVPCWIATRIDPNGGDMAELMRGTASSSCLPLPGRSDSRGNKPGLFRFGASGVLGYAAANGEDQRVELTDLSGFTNSAPMCLGGHITCNSNCNSSLVADFQPVRTPTGMGVEFTCRSGALRDRRLLAPTFSGSDTCFAVNIRGTALVHENDTLPDRQGDLYPTVASGGWARAVRTPGRFEPYYGAGISEATPWTLDRVPLFVANMDVGFRAFSTGLEAQLRPEGMMARKSGVGDFDVVSRVPDTTLLVTRDRALVQTVRFTTEDGGLGIALVVPGRIEVEAQDFQEPFRSQRARRGADSGYELIFTSRDTLFSATYSLDGGMVLQPRAAFPGARILALADTGRADKLGVGAEVWLSLGNLGVGRAYERRAGQWSTEVLPLDLGEDVVDLWSSSAGGTGLRTRVGVANGAIYSLPSALQLTSATDGGNAQSFLELCNNTFVLDERHLFQLAVPAGGGLATWAAVPGIEGDFRGGKLFDGRPFSVFGLPVPIGDELIAVERHGIVWRIPLTGCPPQ